MILVKWQLKLVNNKDSERRVYFRHLGVKTALLSEIEERQFVVCFFKVMDDEKTRTVEPELRSVVAEALKIIPGFEALMVEAAKGSTDANQNDNHKENKEGDKDKDGDNNRTEDGKLVFFAIVNVPSFVAEAHDPGVGFLSHLQCP